MLLHKIGSFFHIGNVEWHSMTHFRVKNESIHNHHTLATVAIRALKLQELGKVHLLPITFSYPTLFFYNHLVFAFFSQYYYCKLKRLLFVVLEHRPLAKRFFFKVIPILVQS
jgi:hypothetical protein